MQASNRGTVTEITAKGRGQITLPQAVCRMFGIVEGTRVRMFIEGAPPRIVLVPVTSEYLRGFRGILKHTPEGDALQRRRKRIHGKGNERTKQQPVRRRTR